MRESLPEGAAEAVHSEARVFVAAFRSLLRRPLKPPDEQPGWRHFGAMETSSYANIVSMLLLLIVFEAPALHLILGAVMEAGRWRGLLRGVQLGSSLYLAAWLMGDLRLLRETPGVSLGHGVLAVALGQRVNGEVALQNVIEAQRLDDSDSPPEGARVLRITPKPRPNCRVRLRSAVSMRGIFGSARHGDMLDIYVDDPAGLVSAITTAIAADASG
jgi:hypothetical protein